MLSFCAQPQGRVAESMIEPWTLALRERGDRSRRCMRAWNQCVSPPLIRTDGHLLPKEKVFLRFAKHWILQLRAGMPFVQNDILETMRTDSWSFVTWCNFMNVCCLHEQIRQLRTWFDRKCMKTFLLTPLFLAVHRQVTSGEKNLLH